MVTRIKPISFGYMIWVFRRVSIKNVSQGRLKKHERATHMGEYPASPRFSNQIIVTQVTTVGFKLPIEHKAEDKALVLGTDQLGDIANLCTGAFSSLSIISSNAF